MSSTSMHFCIPLFCLCLSIFVLCLKEPPKAQKQMQTHPQTQTNPPSSNRVSFTVLVINEPQAFRVLEQGPLVASLSAWLCWSSSILVSN